MPEFRILKPGDEQAMEAFLLPRISSSMFLIGNSRLAGLEDHGETYQGTYTAAFQNGRIVAVAAHYWNRMLVLQAPHYLEELARFVLSASGRPLKGLIGPGDHVDSAVNCLGLKSSDIQLDSKEYLYSLSLDALRVPDALSSGKVRGRRIEAHDIDLVAEWETAFSQEALGETDGPQLREKCRRAVEDSLCEQRAWILENNGQPVARTGFNTTIEEAVQVGGVWTPPEFRSRGYARAAVAASLLDARKKGIPTAFLFTDYRNYPAHKAYEALGFRHIADYGILLLKSPIQP